MSDWIYYTPQTRNLFLHEVQLLLDVLNEQYESVAIRSPVIKNGPWVVAVSEDDDDEFACSHSGRSVEEAVRKFAETHDVQMPAIANDTTSPEE